MWRTMACRLSRSAAVATVARLPASATGKRSRTCGPCERGDEGLRSDDLTSGTPVVGERLGEPGRRVSRRARRVLTERAGALTYGPAIVPADAAFVDLFPGAGADIVDEEALWAGVGVEGETVRIAQAPGVQLWRLWRPRGGQFPRIRQLAVPCPLRGLPGAGPPVEGTTRRILPLSRLRSWAASFGLASSRGSVPASPVEMYKKPSAPISRSPPLWLPFLAEMLSTSTISLAGSITSPAIVNRLTRLRQPPGEPGLGRV